MTIIVFLIDTSASMNQRTYLGARTTLLDVAKGAVETFIKVKSSLKSSLAFITHLLIPFVFFVASFAREMRPALEIGIC